MLIITILMSTSRSNETNISNNQNQTMLTIIMIKLTIIVQSITKLILVILHKIISSVINIK